MANFLKSAVFNDYLYPAITSITFILSAFYLTDIFRSVPAGIGTGLLVTIVVAAFIELIKGGSK